MTNDKDLKDTITEQTRRKDTIRERVKQTAQEVNLARSIRREQQTRPVSPSL